MAYSAPLTNFHLYAFPARRLGLFSEFAPGTNTILHKNNAAEAKAKSGAYAVLDGSMFDHRGVHMQLDRAAGIWVPGNWSGGQGGTLYVQDGVARVVRGKVVPPGASVAMQLSPELVRDGVEVHSDGADEGNAWRAAAGVLRDGRVFFAVAKGGNENFARRLLAEGAWGATYSDGGGSTALLVGDGPRIGDPENRRVAVWILDRGPGAGDALLTLGALAGGLAAGAALGVGAAYAYRALAK
jgi:hypothetical protein